MSSIVPDRQRTEMVIPVSEATYFNTKWKPESAPLCAYDMLYHPPDYNPKSARSDRQEPKIIRKNIWEQDILRLLLVNHQVIMILSPEECSCSLYRDVWAPSSIANSPICTGTFLFMVLLENFLKGRCNIADPCNRVTSVDKLEDAYDYIVVGAGTAGSIVAGRLSENHDDNVLLIEAGGEEPIGVRTPSFYRSFWSNEEVDWRYRTEPGNYCLDQGGKGCSWPLGKMLGGTSGLNGMMYHRGHAADYDAWVEAGAEGWSWEDNLPYFYKTEGNKQIGSLVSGKYHSDSGPMPVQQFNYQPHAVHVLLTAINETGLPIITDLNDPTNPDGFAIAQAFNNMGQRWTTARAYLKNKSERPNLSVKLNAHVNKLLFQGNRVVGVEYLDDSGDIKTVHVNKEVILSAGALHSPQILMLSGIGPRETLEKYNIPLIQDLPVGQNLRNHVGMTLSFLLTKMENLRELDWSTAVDYLLEREGPMSATGVTQLSGLLYSSLANKTLDQPDLQFFFNGFYAECSETGTFGEPAVENPQNGVNVSANAVSLLPRSVGYLTLNSSDPRDPPLFYPGYFSHPDDMVMVKDAARILQKIIESDTLKDYGLVLDPETTSKCSGSYEEWSDSWLECMIRMFTDPQNHQLGTAAIGQVVDPQLKVYNLDGVRVADASVMPRQPTGNPQGPIMMVAERAAEFIKKENK